MLSSSFRSKIFSPSRYTSNRPFAPGVKEIATSGPYALKNSFATHVAVAWCCHATQYTISTRTFHSVFVAISTLLCARNFLPANQGIHLQGILHLPPRKSSGYIPDRCSRVPRDQAALRPRKRQSGRRMVCGFSRNRLPLSKAGRIRLGVHPGLAHDLPSATTRIDTPSASLVLSGQDALASSVPVLVPRCVELAHTRAS